ncbi:hypothetical protein V1477_021130 [Vespula maculifrons]|uniref:Uncharacterized protein n=1 Tax=Vespula maculifrons TaxID=7453 RepID=A0ABD2AH83_VESMC
MRNNMNSCFGTSCSSDDTSNMIILNFNENVTTLVPHYYNNHRSEYWILINKHIGLSEEWFEKSLQNLFKESAPLPVAEK